MFCEWESSAKWIYLSKVPSLLTARTIESTNLSVRVKTFALGFGCHKFALESQNVKNREIFGHRWKGALIRYVCESRLMNISYTYSYIKFPLSRKLIDISSISASYNFFLTSFRKPNHHSMNNFISARAGTAKRQMIVMMLLMMMIMLVLP